MMYADHWIDLPANEQQFWDRLEECFLFIERNLLCRVETREEALNRDETDKIREHIGGLIRYRDTDDRENLLYFLENGRELLPEIRFLLNQRKFTQQLFIKWGDLNYCHGWVSNAIFSGSDDLAAKRGGLKTAQSRNRERHSYLVASHLLPLLNKGMQRKEAERVFAATIKAAIDSSTAMPPLEAEELQELLTKTGHLKSTYRATKLSKKQMKEILAETRENSPQDLR